MAKDLLLHLPSPLFLRFLFQNVISTEMSPPNGNTQPLRALPEPWPKQSEIKLLTQENLLSKKIADVTGLGACHFGASRIFPLKINVKQYWYDAEGQRIRKISAAGTEEYVYDKDGHQMGEMQSNGTFNRVELYAGDRHLATYDNVNGPNPGQTVFIHDDWQGTERVRSLYDGSSYESCTNLPFGDDQTCNLKNSAPDPSPLHYTGRTRDVETNLDYFGARYYSSGMAHWMSPDWADKPTSVPYANFGDPQSLNLYGFVTNNPVSRQDSDGHMLSLSQYWGSLDGGGAQAFESGMDGEASGPERSNFAGYSTLQDESDRAETDVMAQVQEDSAKRHTAQQQSGGVKAKARGGKVTYTYPDGSKVVLKGDHPFRDNNPGDLRSGHGSIGRDGGFAIYPSLDAGVAALGETLTGKYGNSSISDTMKAFAPGSDGNDPVAYAATLASAVGVPVSTKISALSPAQLMTFQYTIANAEGYNSARNTASYTAPPQ